MTPKFITLTLAGVKDEEGVSGLYMRFPASSTAYRKAVLGPEVGSGARSAVLFGSYVFYVRETPEQIDAMLGVTGPLDRIGYPDGEWMPRMWDMALASSDDETVGSALTLKAVAASHGYHAVWVRQEVPGSLEAAGHREILATVPPEDAPAGYTLIGRTMDEDGIINWYVRPSAIARAALSTDATQEDRAHG